LPNLLQLQLNSFDKTAIPVLATREVLREPCLERDLPYRFHALECPKIERG
jgi:hypothetical protein